MNDLTKLHVYKIYLVNENYLENYIRIKIT